jgi:anti-anti-sigma factor
MPARSARHCFQWEDVGAVTVVRFTIRTIRADEDICNIFAEINRLVDEGTRTQLLLDFGAVRDFASLTVARLLALHKKLQPPQGRLVLCNLTPVVAEILKIMNLDRYFQICATQEEGLRSFS